MLTVNLKENNHECCVYRYCSSLFKPSEAKKDKSISTDEDKLVPPTIACNTRIKISDIDPTKLIYVDFGIFCSLIIVAVVIIFKSYLLLKTYFY